MLRSSTFVAGTTGFAFFSGGAAPPPPPPPPFAPPSAFPPSDSGGAEVSGGGAEDRGGAEVGGGATAAPASTVFSVAFVPTEGLYESHSMVKVRASARKAPKQVASQRGSSPRWT